MIQADRLEIERADAKNSLEEYVYDMRDKISTVLEDFMPEEVGKLVEFSYGYSYFVCIFSGSSDIPSSAEQYGGLVV